MNLLAFVIAGLVSGSVYGLAGVGLVLTYKTSGIFNFAYGALATVAAYVFYFLYFQHHLDLPISLLVAVVVLGAALGVGFERFAERVSQAKLSMQIAATVGVLLVVEALATILYGPDTLSFPQFLPTQQVRIAGTYVGVSQMVIFGVSIAAAGSLYVFVRQARLGKAMRAVVANPELLDLAGTNPAAVRRWAWMIGCFFAALSGLLLAPSVELNSSVLTLLVVQAFGAAALGAFSNLVLTWIGGVAIGIGSALVSGYVNSTSILGGLSASLPFVVLFLAIFFYPRRHEISARVLSVRRSSETWAAPFRVQVAGAVMVVGFLCCVPLFAGFRISGWTVALTYVILFLSLGLLVRTSGQISLCQATFAAIGAVAFSRLAGSLGLPWLAALLVAGLVAVPIGALLAVPAIRLGGLFLALATFGFGLLVKDMFYESSLMFGRADVGVSMPAPSLDWLGIGTSTGFYYVVLAITVFCALGILSLNRTRLGRLLKGISDSPIALTASGANVNLTRVIVFCISAYIAGVSGALAGIVLSQVNGSFYDPTVSLTYLTLIVISLGSEPWYALLAAAGLGIVPIYISSGNITYYLELVFGISAVLISLGGFPGMPQAAGVFLDRVGRRRSATGAAMSAMPPEPAAWHPMQSPAASRPSKPAGAATIRADALEGVQGLPASRPSKPAGDILELRSLSVSFGGLVALDRVDLKVPQGRITGLIGPNGAGKTTCLNAVSGFIKCPLGTIILGGQDISHASPARRARLGLGRSFQQVQLCDSLTVEANVGLGREASLAGANLANQIFAGRAERAEVQARVAQAMELCGITALLGCYAGNLTTGQRRLVELARCLAGSFRLLLLDEPSSGLDSNETSRFGTILKNVVAEQGVGIALVEHDMSLVMDICSYIYVLDFGKLIFEGTPAEVTASQVVQTAYLGGSAELNTAKLQGGAGVL